MKRSSILIVALTLILGFATTSYANIYATNVEVSATVITTGATNSTVDISFLLNEDADSGVDVKIYSGATLVRTLTLATATKGANSVTWDGTDASAATLPDGDYTFEVTAADDGHTEWTKISDPLKTVIYAPRGVTINRNPDSEYFGRIYVANAWPGTSSNPGAFRNGDSILVYDADQTLVLQSDGDVAWNASDKTPGKLSIGFDDRLYVTDYGADELWSFDANVSGTSALHVIDADNKMTGEYVSANYVTGVGEDQALYLADMHYGAYRGIVKYDLGADGLPVDGDVGVEAIARPNGSYYQSDVELDADGNIFFTQFRGDFGQALPLLKYPPFTGTTMTLADTLWTLSDDLAYGAMDVAVDAARNRVVWANEYDGRLVFHNATSGDIVDTLSVASTRVRAIAFDAAGNLYTCDNSSEYWHIWSSPDGANSFTTPGRETITIETLVLEGDVLVNEFDTNTSSAEYIELYNTTDLAIDLAAGSYVLVFVNGSGDIIYQATDLTGSIPANGYFVLAETGVTDIGGYTPDQNASWGSFQNGTDGFALVKGAAAADFANNGVYSTSLAAVTGATQQDAIIYAGGDYPDSGLEAEFNLPGRLIMNGSSGSSIRVTDGQGGSNYANSDWEIATTRTPGSDNFVPPPTYIPYTIVEIQTPDAGGDTSQYYGDFVETSGIITALTGYSFYMQDGTADYSGIYVYIDGSTSAYALGDAVTVKGVANEYNALTQISSIADVTINSSGNDLPAPIVLVTNTLAEGHEGMLVTISGACTAVSTDASGDHWAFKLDDGSGDALVDDQIYSDAENVTSVGSPYDVVGVVNYYYGAFTVNPRDINDVTDLSVLPSIVSITSMSDTEIDVAYTLDVTAVDVADYSIAGTPVTFTSATIDAEDAMLVHLVASAAMTADVIIDTLIDAANADTALAYVGISPIAFTNALNPGGSFELGIPATVAGLITADDEYNNVWINDGVGAYNGVLLFDYDLGDTLDTGDEVVVSGDLDIYNNLSELKHITLIAHTSSDNPTVPSMIEGATIDSSLAADTNPAEQWEGQLVSIDSALVLAYDDSDYRYELTDDAGVTSFLVGDDVDYHFGDISLSVGSTYNLVGVVSYYYGHYIISPRDMADLVELDVAGPELAGVVAVSETQLQLRFSEPVVSAEALTLANYAVADDLGSQAPTVITELNAFTYLLDVPAIVPNKLYTVTVNGIHDMLGNAIADDSAIDVVLDIPGFLPIDRIMNDFTVDVGNWGHPTYSGSTSGILTTSTFASSDSMAFAGTHSGEMILLDDPGVDGGWFVRLWNINRVDRIDADSKMFFYLYGGGADMQARIVLKDDDGYEASRWQDITHTEDDWQVISFDLENDEIFPWLTGNGTINATSGSVSIDGLQIRCSEDVSVNLYLNSITERYNIDPVEVTFDVQMSVQTLMETFVPGTDFLDVAGTINGWGDQAMVLTDPEADSLYTITVTDVYPGETLEYKFRINGNWDTSEFPGGGANRTYVVPDSNSVVFHWYDDVDTYVGIAGIAIPTEYALHDNYPNPFNPITNIKYDIPENTQVRIAVYNTIGQHVIDLVNEEQAAGFYQLQWNGLSKQGRPVSSGLYIYRLVTPEFTQTEKMTYLK